jgi:peptidoglycan/xylan/chitin deacetylase (PgdA/CDA1 family)
MKALRMMLPLAAAALAAPVTTVPWNGYTGAVSFTYDDARNSQVPALVNQLDSVGVKATFFVCISGVGGNFTGKLTEWIQVARSGHEIANHTRTHTNMTDANSAALSKDMADYLRGLDTSIQSVTLAYPNCSYPGTSGKNGIAIENFIARGCHSSASTNYPWGTEPSDWMRIDGLIMSPTNNATGVSLLNNSKTQNRWAVILIHDVADPTPDQYSVTPPNNLQLLNAAIANGMWIDTYQNIGAYYRAHFTLDTVKAKTVSGGWALDWASPHAKMPRSVPMRVRLDSAVFGAAFTVRQGGKVVPPKPDGSFVIDFMNLRLDVSPGASALASSHGTPRAIRAAALRASLRPVARPAGEARLLDGKAVSGTPAAGVFVEQAPAKARAAR